LFIKLTNKGEDKLLKFTESGYKNVKTIQQVFQALKSVSHTVTVCAFQVLHQKWNRK